MQVTEVNTSPKTDSKPNRRNNYFINLLVIHSKTSHIIEASFNGRKTLIKFFGIIKVVYKRKNP